MNPLGASFIPAFNQPHISQNNSGVSELPEEFLTDGEYMFYDVTNEEDSKEENSPELEHSLTRGQLIKKDLAHLSFLEYETEHFIFKWLPESDAENSLESIAEKREAAWKNICDFFFINPPEKQIFYIFQNDRQAYCKTWGKTFASRALPEEHMAGIIYRNEPGFYEQINYGHELTHLLEFYFLPYLMRVPPYFREGMADYLSQSGADLHLRYITFLKAGLADEAFTISQDRFAAPNYMESASFLHYLTQAYSKEHMIELYRRLAVLQKGELITIEKASEIFISVLGAELSFVMNNYYSYICSIWNTSLPQLPPEDQTALKELFLKSEEFVTKENEKGINSLYSNDFYYTTPASERDIFIFHMMPMENMKPIGYEFFDLGSWLYGKSAAVKTVFENKLNGAFQTRVFAAEKIAGIWRFSPKYQGGKEVC